MQRLLLGIVLADFVGLNAYVVAQVGYLGFFQMATANIATIALLVDLTIALSLISLWLVRDARARGVSPALYLGLTATLGSVGPLLYLLLRGNAPAPAPARTAAFAQS